MNYYHLALFTPDEIPEVFMTDDWEKAAEQMEIWTKDMDSFIEKESELLFQTNDEIFEYYALDYLERLGLDDFGDELDEEDISIQDALLGYIMLNLLEEEDDNDE